MIRYGGNSSVNCDAAFKARCNMVRYDAVRYGAMSTMIVRWDRMRYVLTR